MMLKQMFIIRQSAFVLNFIFFVLELERVHGAGRIKIQLLSYNYSLGQELNADCCHFNSTLTGNCSIDTCNRSVNLCLEKADTAAGSCALGLQTIDLKNYKNVVNVNGSTSFKDTTNMLTFTIQQNQAGNMTLNLTIINQDGNGTSEVFDSMQHTFLYTPGFNGNQSSFQITLQGNMSSLTMDVIMRCGQGLYGLDCGRYCRSTSERRFTCDSQGFKICQKGWTGKDCESVIGDCSNNSCENGAFCKQMGNSSYSCECASNYTGPFCEYLRECAVIVNQMNSSSLTVSMTVGVSESFSLADLQHYVQTQQTNCSLGSTNNQTGNQRDVTLNCSFPVQDIKQLQKEVHDFCKTATNRTTKDSDLESTISNYVQSVLTESTISSYVQPAFTESTINKRVQSAYMQSAISNYVQSSFIESTKNSFILSAYTESIISSSVWLSDSESTASNHVSSSFPESTISSPVQSLNTASTTSNHVWPSYTESTTSSHVWPSYTESTTSSPVWSSYMESTISSPVWQSYAESTIFSLVQPSPTESTTSSHVWPSYTESTANSRVWSSHSESTTNGHVWQSNTESTMFSLVRPSFTESTKSNPIQPCLTKSTTSTAVWSFSLISLQSYHVQSSSPALTRSSSVLSSHSMSTGDIPTLSSKHSTQSILSSASGAPNPPNHTPTTNNKIAQKSTSSESAKGSVLPIAGGVVGGLAAVAASAFVGVFIYKRKLKSKIHISNLEEETITEQKSITVHKEISCEHEQENSIPEQKKD